MPLPKVRLHLEGQTSSRGREHWPLSHFGLSDESQKLKAPTIRGETAASAILVARCVAHAMQAKDTAGSSLRRKNGPFWSQELNEAEPRVNFFQQFHDPALRFQQPGSVAWPVLDGSFSTNSPMKAAM